MIVPPVACKTPALDQGEAGQLESLRRTATVQVSHFHDTMLKSWIGLVKSLKYFIQEKKDIFIYCLGYKLSFNQFDWRPTSSPENFLIKVWWTNE